MQILSRLTMTLGLLWIIALFAIGILGATRGVDAALVSPVSAICSILLYGFGLVATAITRTPKERIIRTRPRSRHEDEVADALEDLT